MSVSPKPHGRPADLQEGSGSPRCLPPKRYLLSDNREYPLQWIWRNPPFLPFESAVTTILSGLEMPPPHWSIPQPNPPPKESFFRCGCVLLLLFRNFSLTI